MLDVDTKLKAGNRSLIDDNYTFSIGGSSTQLVLRFQDGTEFGVLNNHTSAALKDLIDRSSIQFDALGSTLTLLETIGKATKASDAVVRVNINVYGPKEAGKETGRHLTTHRVYLQRPDKLRPESLYDNPHVLKFPDMDMSSLEYPLEVAPARVSTSSNAEHFRKTISNVYASLTRGTKLKRVDGDHRIATQLLPYVLDSLSSLVS
jgi:SWI/SNF-related matrix-associated actin-dependent regulator of chromatin subfamily A3